MYHAGRGRVGGQSTEGHGRERMECVGESGREAKAYRQEKIYGRGGYSMGEEIEYGIVYNRGG